MLEIIIAGIMLGALLLYALLAGADYGGGVWDLFSSGKRKDAQRKVIEDAIGPVWEANHVWLILVVVVLFTAFPKAFAAITTALHIPLSLLLIGIIFRGTAFVFRKHDVKNDSLRNRWTHVFSVSSLITPVLLGITLGGIASGKIDLENGISTMDFFSAWLAPFPFAVGFFALTIFAFLAATYLTLETEDPELQNDFRIRALIAAVAVGILALIVLLLASTGAPRVFAGISRSWWAIGLHLITAIFAVVAFLTLYLRKYQLARFFAAAQVSMILIGWAFAQFPYLVEPNITIYNSAAPKATLRLLLGALFAGAIVLFPSYYYLLRVFKSDVIATDD